MIEFSLPPKWEKREEKWGKTGGREDKNWPPRHQVRAWHIRSVSQAEKKGAERDTVKRSPRQQLKQLIRPKRECPLQIYDALWADAHRLHFVILSCCQPSWARAAGAHLRRRSSASSELHSRARLSQNLHGLAAFETFSRSQHIRSSPVTPVHVSLSESFSRLHEVRVPVEASWAEN
jgi:hypothetical protein